MERREVDGELLDDGQELLLAHRELFGAQSVEQMRARAAHRLDEVVASEFDVHDPFRLEHAALRRVAREKLHLVGIDGGIDHDPRAAAELAAMRNVHDDGLAVHAELVDDVRPVLENLAEHVAQPTREPSPVGKNHERQSFVVEVGDDLRRLEGGIREPDLTGLLLVDGLRSGKAGICGHLLLRGARLDGDHPNRQATEPGAARDHRFAPLRHALHERLRVEEALEHLARVVRRRGRDVTDGSRDWVRRRHVRQWSSAHLGRVRQPLHDRLDAAEVVRNDELRDTVRPHHLGPANLRVGGVHLAPEQLVERGAPGEDERRVLLLDDAVRKPGAVRANPDRAARDVRERERLLVRLGGDARDGPGSLEALDADAADDVGDLPPHLAGVLDAGRLDRALLVQPRVVLVAEVDVLPALARVRRVVPRRLESRLDELVEADARARVGGDVHARDALLDCDFESLRVNRVLVRREGPAHMSDVVGNENEIAAFRVGGREHGAAPAHDPNVVLPRRPLNLLEHSLRVEHHLDRVPRLGRHNLIVRAVGPRHARIVPENVDKVVAVRGVEVLRHHALALDAVQDRVCHARLGVEVELNLEVVPRRVVGDEATGAHLHLDPRHLEAPQVLRALREESLHSLLREVNVVLLGANHVDEDVVPRRALLADGELEGRDDVGEDRVVVELAHGHLLVGSRARAVHLLDAADVVDGQHLILAWPKVAGEGAERLGGAVAVRGGWREQGVLVVNDGANKYAAVAARLGLGELLLREENPDAVVGLGKVLAQVPVVAWMRRRGGGDAPGGETRHALHLPVRGEHGRDAAARHNLHPRRGAVAVKKRKVHQLLARHEHGEVHHHELRAQALFRLEVVDPVEQVLRGAVFIKLCELRGAHEERHSHAGRVGGEIRHEANGAVEVLDDKLGPGDGHLARDTDVEFHHSGIGRAHDILDSVPGVHILDRGDLVLGVVHHKDALVGELYDVRDGARAAELARERHDGVAPTAVTAAPAGERVALFAGGGGGSGGGSRRGCVGHLFGGMNRPAPAIRGVVGAVVRRAEHGVLRNALDLVRDHLPLALTDACGLLLADDDLLGTLSHGDVVGALQHHEPRELVVANLLLHHAVPVNLLEDLEEHGVLARELAVRVRKSSHLDEVILVLGAEGNEGVFEAAFLAENLLDVEVHVDEGAQHAALKGVEAMVVAANKFDELLVILVSVLVDKVLDGAHRERDVLHLAEKRRRRVAGAHLADLRLELLQLLEGSGSAAPAHAGTLLCKVIHHHHRRTRSAEELREGIADAVVAREDAAHARCGKLKLGTVRLVELLAGVAARRQRWEGAAEVLHRLDRGRVLELHADENVASLERGARRLVVRHVARARGDERHHRLHHLNLAIRLALLDVPAIRDEVADELPGGRGGHNRGVEIVGKLAGPPVDVELEPHLALLLVKQMRPPVEKNLEPAIRELHCLELHHRVVHHDVKVRWPAHRHREAVLVVVVDELELVLREVGVVRVRGDAALEASHEHRFLGLMVLVRHHDGAANHRDVVRDARRGILGRDEAVEPRRVVLVPGKLRLFDERLQVLDVGRNFATDGELAQRLDQQRAGVVAGRGERKDVSKLRVGKLVHARAAHAHAEVASDARDAPVVELVDGARGGLEARLRILRGNARRHAVPARRGGGGFGEVNHVSTRRVRPEVGADVRDAVQRQAHRHLELHGRDVDAGDRLRHGVLHLEARVHLQKGGFVRLHVVEVLHRAGGLVAHFLREANGALFELDLHRARRHAHRPFLDDFLVAPLHAAVAAVERDGVAVLVGHHLHLEVPARHGELLDKDWRARHLRLHLRERHLHLLDISHLADALSAAALRSLDHARKTHALDAFERLLERLERRLAQGVGRDCDVGHRQARPGPRNHVHPNRLRQQICANFVADGVHRLRGRAEEDDVVRRELEGKLWVFGRVAPTRPHGVSLDVTRHLDDKLDVGVVVLVRSPGDVHKLIRETNVFCVGANVLRRCHDDKVQDVAAILAERLVRPTPHRPNRLCSSQAVVGDQDARDGAVSAVLLHPPIHDIVRRRHGRRGRACSRRRSLPLRCLETRAPSAERRDD
mmetsp:Transcript_22294/g.72301  ORF Transcript_22294/g.72301 Transcript_22294/m.72301 type:complete len:2084 (-) Transcript_22294:68-6319(-)